MSEDPPTSPPDRPDDELLAAFVGPQWERHYRARFDAFHGGRGPRGHLSWNWAAALLPFWHAYRRRASLQVAWTVMLVAVTMVIVRAFDMEMRIPLFLPVGPLLIGWIVVGAAQGLLGDRAVYGEALRAARRHTNPTTTREELLALARRQGGVSWRDPLLCAALLAFAVTLMPRTRPHATGYLGYIRSDLRNLVSVQDSVFAERGAYLRDLTGIFVPTASVTVEMREVTARGWSATGRYQGARGECGVYVGDATPPIAGAPELEPRCDIHGPRRPLDWLWRR